ncbi:MAG: hypoxanthine phosphoribosyltransferase [Phycisphaeraceae bacterium]|nr:MAG: hypoxanthine phosphoribosyltransferase [Phycisphaeraceae bacterium]
MRADLGETLVTREAIARRVEAMGRALASDLEGSMRASGDDPSGGNVVLIPVLTGALVFTADLIRELPLKLSLRVVAVSSYPGKSMASKGVKMASELPGDLRGRHVVVVDDILDSGQTLGLLRDLIVEQEPASVRIVVLLRKPESARKRAVPVEYVGFDIPDAFVVGYGLDYDGFYRNHPEIATLRPDAIG